MARLNKKTTRNSAPRIIRARVSQQDVPRHTLPEAVRVARVIEDHYGGLAVSPMDVATSMESTPSSSWFRMLTGAAIAYGLTEGAYNANRILLTPLGQRIVAPIEEEDDKTALKEALLRPRVIREFLTRYDRKKLPPPDIARNVLASLGVDKAATERTLQVILESSRHAGVLRVMKGSDWVDLQAPSGQMMSTFGRTREAEEDPGDEVPDEGTVVAGAPADIRQNEESTPRPIFIGHGKKRGPVEKLERILTSFKVPYRVAIEEPNRGRPIPTKVRDLIQSCGSAILVFTRDEHFVDADGQDIWRPSENLVYELGATSYQYADRVVVLMEKGLQFPSNFNSIGRIEFEEDSIEAKTMEIMQELIAMGLLRLTPA